MKRICKGSARVTDIKSKAVCNGHILDGAVETLAGVTRLQTPVRVDGPVDASNDLMLLHRLHNGINRRVARIRLGSTEIHVFDEATRGHARSRARRRRSEEHTSELQSPCNLVCRLLLEK